MEKHSGKSIASKITRGIVDIALLCSLIVGIAGIVSISIINNQSNQLYNTNLKPLEPVYNIGTDFLNLNIMLDDMALNKTANQFNYQRQAPKIYNDMLSELNIYEQNISPNSVKEMTNCKQLGINLKRYNDDLNGIIKDINSGDMVSAEFLMDGDEAFIANQVKTEINTAFSINIDNAQQRNDTSTLLFYLDIAALVAVTIVLIIIAKRTGNRIAKKISIPIIKMVESANAISKGQLDVDLNIDSSDETQILAEAFKKIVDAFRNMETDVNMLISQALEGKLKARADSSKHYGDYREIISGVNKMLDTIEKPLNVATDFISRLAEGDCQNIIDNTYKGYYAILIDNLNKVRQSIKIMDEEASKLAQAGINGDFDLRGDESKLNGVYANIIVGVNLTFDSIKAPLDVASEYIAKMANGEELEILDNNYKGYYGKLIDNLNSVHESLNTLLSESLKLAAAGEIGELDIRGDVSNVKGAYAQIIGGFNKTMESIVVPLNDAGLVLGKMANNDFTSFMSDGYKGKMRELAISVNCVIESLLSVEEIVTEVGKGNFDSLEILVQSGTRSKNDKLLPSLISMMNSIQDVIVEAERHATAAINGELSFRVDETKFEGGYRHIIEGMNKTIEAFAAPIEEASQVLQELANRNLTVEMTGEFKGEYNQIKTAMNQSISSINELIGKMSIAADEVASGSKQVCDSSQALSQGVEQQASAIEKLTSTFMDVSEQTRSNALDAAKASSLESTVQTQAAMGNKKMSQMLQSMSQIRESSSKISMVIKVIESIAFQTNILALNAAVEAARAGQAGKGFAVVAAEVRNLAVKSAEAANQTNDLIVGSIKKVEVGTKIADETAEMLVTIFESVQKTAKLVGNIATASQTQASAISTIDMGISEVSNVVQANSATAEESAASSKELAGQADTLKEIVGLFKLKDIDRFLVGADNVEDTLCDSEISESTQTIY